MGGGGGSSSSSTTTQQTDERIAASDNAIVVQLDSGANLTLTDPLAVENVKTFLNAVEGIFGETLETGEALFGETLTLIKGENARTQNIIEQVLTQNQSEDRQNFADLLKWGAVIVIGLSAAGAVKWR